MVFVKGYWNNKYFAIIAPKNWSPSLANISTCHRNPLNVCLRIASSMRDNYKIVIVALLTALTAVGAISSTITVNGLVKVRMRKQIVKPIKAILNRPIALVKKMDTTATSMMTVVI